MMIYIHIPYCAQVCPYCDFYRTANHKGQNAFVVALCREIVLRAHQFSDRCVVDTVYWGGGTPSLLKMSQFERIVQTLWEHFDLSQLQEHTLEADPATFDKCLAQTWKDHGVNRISLGVQSFVDDQLQVLGRGHRETDVENSWDILGQVGLNNVSIDLMTCCPEQSIDSLQYSLKRALDWQAPHFSVYTLNLEPQSVWGKWLKYRPERLVLPHEDEEVDQLQLVSEQLFQAGYERYEISNYAKERQWESKHNWGYWQGKPYVGLGPSAHSFDGDCVRSQNIASVSQYVKALQTDQLPPGEQEQLSDEQKDLENLLLGLRTREGVVYDKLDRDIVQSLEKEGWVTTDSKVYLTQAGQNVYNKILEILMSF